MTLVLVPHFQVSGPALGNHFCACHVPKTTLLLRKCQKASLQVTSPLQSRQGELRWALAWQGWPDPLALVSSWHEYVNRARENEMQIDWHNRQVHLMRGGSNFLPGYDLWISAAVRNVKQCLQCGGNNRERSRTSTTSNRTIQSTCELSMVLPEMQRQRFALTHSV